MNFYSPELRRFSVLLLAGTLVGFGAPHCLAASDNQTPTTQPHWHWGMRGAMQYSGLRFHRSHDDKPKADEPTDQQWKQIAEYMQLDLPNAWRTYSHQNPTRQAQMRRRIFAEFRATDQLRQSDQMKLYSVKVRERKLLDEAAGLIHRYRKASLDERPAIRRLLQEKTRLYLEARLEERDLRIEKLDKQLKQEKSRLAEDRKNLSHQVDERVAHLLNRTPPPPREADEQPPATTQPTARQ